MMTATENIRNVVLLSHVSAGKTSLAEAMLYNAGAISRLGKVEEGNTTSDYEPEEVKRRISISLSLLPFSWRETKINVIDTPGYADFVGEVKAGIHAADGVVLVVCAASGVEVGTEQVWQYANERQLPRLILVNKMDRENADFRRSLNQIQDLFGRHCLPLQLPIGAQSDFRGTVDLLSRKAYLNSKEEAVSPSEALEEDIESFRDKLVETIAETDDALTDRYLGGETISDAELWQALAKGVKEDKIVPVLATSSLRNIGTIPFIDALCKLLPSPKERGTIRATTPQGEELMEPEPTSPLAAQVFKTTTDPYIGKLTYLRVFSGTLYSDSSVWNSSRGKQERIGQLFTLRGKTQEPVPQLGAGDIGAVAKLSDTSTGDTLCQREHPVILPPIAFPSSQFASAVSPKTKADLDKMSTVLARMTEEDQTIQVRKDPDTLETILVGMGEVHVDVTMERMRRKFGVEVNVQLPKVPYKETVTIPMKAEYKHKKQTGGHGQYGHVLLELQPMPRGSGVAFEEHIVGGVVPKNYIPAVEKGVMEAVQEGVLANYPVADLKVTLYDGSYHAVDSSDISFKIAAMQAVKKGLTQGHPVILEPIMNLRVTVPDSYMGETIGILNSKRARVLHTLSEDGRSTIEAEAPLAELLRYATEIRSITQGRGSYTMEFSHYEEVPSYTAQNIINAAKKEAEKG
ncbi:MAG: elongation factor G [Chloroflexi bacterium]|nr:elongation factor G [Chloroflexota bacterium]